MSGNTSSNGADRSGGKAGSGTKGYIYKLGNGYDYKNFGVVSDTLSISVQGFEFDRIKQGKDVVQLYRANADANGDYLIYMHELSSSMVNNANSNQLYHTVGTKVHLIKQGTSETLDLPYYYVPGAGEIAAPPPVITKPGTEVIVPAPPQDPNQYQWNLPPHKWSLPFTAGSDLNNMPNGHRKSPSDDRYRRGRIWWRATQADLTTTDGTGKTITVDNSDRKYGFQFLWNPETFGTAVSVQMDATPQIQDRFAATVGAFPATETISFTLRIDRTNDFACANAYFKRPTNIVQDSTNTGQNNFISAKDTYRFIRFYQNAGSFNSGLIKKGKVSTVEEKLVDLFQRGTLADIEYLYKAINGPGPGGGSSSNDYWKNARGIITADIGWLMPTLLNVDVGPLSYIGYVTSMSVTHIGFTPDMIPIRSDVNISLNLLATAGLSTSSNGGK